LSRLSKESPEQYVRSVLEKEFGKKLPKKTIRIGHFTHQFDLFSEDGSIVGEVKSGRDIDSTGKIKPYRFAECCLDCLYLMSTDIENKIFVLTDKQMYETFKKMIAGLPIKDVEIRLIEV
jgi:hypothetical protein